MEVENGVLDKYLTDDEQKYFDNRGDENSEKAIESQAEENERLEEEVNDNNVAPNDDSSDNQPDESDESESEPESSVDDSDDESTQEKTPRDYEKAFKAELHKRKELKAEFEANAKKTQELENALNEFKSRFGNQPVAQPEQPKEVVPDPTEDPLGYQQYKIDKLEKTLTQQSQYLKQQYDQAQRSRSEEAFVTTYKNAAKSFAQEKPDFFDAYNHVIEARKQQYLVSGYDEQQVAQLIEEDEKALAAKAFTDKVNPAQRIYELASAMGYSPAKKDSPKSDKIDSLKKGLKNSKSLKSGGGQPVDKTLGIEDIDSMDFDQFDQVWETYKKRAKG